MRTLKIHVEWTGESPKRVVDVVVDITPPLPPAMPPIPNGGGGETEAPREDPHFDIDGAVLRSKDTLKSFLARITRSVDDKGKVGANCFEPREAKLRELLDIRGSAKEADVTIKNS